MIETAKFYHAEVEWRDKHYIPTSVEEHLQISTRSSVCTQITNLALISLGEVTTREDVDWALTFPKIIRGACIVGRVGNDIVSHEVYQISPRINKLLINVISSFLNAFVSSGNVYILTICTFRHPLKHYFLQGPPIEALF